MTDRENSPAYAALPRSARRVFAATERAIGDRSSASVSYVDFWLDHRGEPLRGATMTTPVVSARRAATSVRACGAL
jgi:hypothetical protein